MQPSLQSKQGTNASSQNVLCSLLHLPAPPQAATDFNYFRPICMAKNFFKVVPHSMCSPLVWSGSLLHISSLAIFVSWVVLHFFLRAYHRTCIQPSVMGCLACFQLGTITIKADVDISAEVFIWYML